MTTSLSAFPQTIAALARQLREAKVDHEAFERPLLLCQLHQCRATCCHDGVFLSQEEAEVLGEDVVELPDGRIKTITVPAKPHQLADDFPEHFPKTRCVFLDEQHRCQWQLRSVAEEKHAWFYKPISCWMHPILLRPSWDRPQLTILSAEGDPHQFASCTPCGRVTEGADPARLSLRSELEMLSKISGRDFLRELNAPTL